MREERGKKEKEAKEREHRELVQGFIWPPHRGIIFL